MPGGASVRAMVPRPEGWVSDPEEFHDHAVDEAHVDRGVEEVMAEVDDTDAAGLALAWGLGARQTGSSLVLQRRS